MSKVSVIGAGNVGATAAREISNDRKINEVVLLDIKEGVAEGKALDINQALILINNETKVIGVTNDYSVTANSDVVVITSGVPRKPGMTREELVGINSSIMESVIKGCDKYSPNAIYIVVSNPMDTMTYQVIKILEKLHEGELASEGFIDYNKRVIGMGGMLDSARFCYSISEALGIRDKKIEGFVVGGHGDTTMVPVMSNAFYGDKSIESLLSTEQQSQIIEKTMKGGATITSLLGTSAWYAPAIAIAALVHFIINDSNASVPCSVYREEYGVCIGSLIKVDSFGIKEINIENYLNSNELKAFLQSIESIKKVNEALPLCE